MVSLQITMLQIQNLLKINLNNNLMKWFISYILFFTLISSAQGNNPPREAFSFQAYLGYVKKHHDQFRVKSAESLLALEFFLDENIPLRIRQSQEVKDCFRNNIGADKMNDWPRSN